jgi:predicted permease
MNDNSAVNTILLVVILVAIVGFVVWYFGGNRGAAPAGDNNGLNVNVELPLDNNGGEGQGQGEGQE